MTYLRITPKKFPQVVEGDLGLERMQAEVDGYIETYYPFDDNACIVCNEEGKINGMDLNRALRGEDGEIYDIIAGTFLVVGLGGEDFQSLTPEQAERYKQMFWHPEIFFTLNDRVHVLPLESEQ